MATDPLIASITLFGGDFAPRGTALCQGQLLPISSNTALFSILGTIYGGDGRTTFALPDLRGRVAMGNGNGPGLTPRRLGQRSGNETTTLIANNLPSHSHAATTEVTIGIANEIGNTHVANSAVLAKQAKDTAAGGATIEMYVDSGSATITTKKLAGVSATTTVGNTGASTSFSNMQPFLVLNYIIAIYGVFPSRS